MFDRWYLDAGVVKEFVRWIATNEEVGSSIIDLGAGGGHYSARFNQTGLVSVGDSGGGLRLVVGWVRVLERG